MKDVNKAERFKKIRGFLPHGFAKIILKRCADKKHRLSSEKTVYNVFTQGTEDLILEDEILKLAMENRKKRLRVETNWAVLEKEYKQAS